MSIHAHVLLEQIANSTEIKSLVSWKEIAQEQFGNEAQFENCGGMQFNIDQVFEFFQKKQKIEVNLENFVIPKKENICSGHGHSH
jgi:probable metal-binding protein